MNENKKTKWALIIGIAIPILMIIVIAFSVYLPNMNFKNNYDFIYTFNDGNSYCLGGGGYYSVSNGKIIQNELSVANLNDSYCSKTLTTQTVKPLYRYISSKDIFEKISYEDTRKLQLNEGPYSPDGVIVFSGYSSNSGMFELFGGGRSSGQNFQLQNKDKGVKKVMLATNESYYNFKFIGWVIPENK